MQLTTQPISLLKALISIPSISTKEEGTASLIYEFLNKKGIEVKRSGNNIWAANKYFNKARPTILLNSHHDTVKPNAGYTLDPLNPIEKEGRLYGLGSNDAGGCLVSLLAVFLHFYSQTDLKYNLVFAATAEEEISGRNGIESLIPQLPEINFAIVGEPTQMHLAIAEKGLMVLDCITYGKAGHAAREEGENAIYKAMATIRWFQTFQFPQNSEVLGPIRMSVTQINAGKQHNLVPDQCRFVVDVRTTDAYTHEQTLAIIKANVDCEVVPRSTRLTPSGIDREHPVVRAGIALGRNIYGSPTLSDQALMPFPSVKMGPGDSARSHTADEYIELKEIEEGITLYIRLIQLILNKGKDCISNLETSSAQVSRQEL